MHKLYHVIPHLLENVPNMIGDEHMAVKSTSYLPQISEEVQIMDYSFDNSILVESGVQYENNDNEHQI